ncbi:hypothetical protein Cylst_4529 [Cylindrospermum stagnale PCC 7417]|uniref:Uncharacterized protein n=1 Tax=Cylindrospermum stagnale PCC 7417 TaxID=56107 RepID=K9X4N7_9NOST|nr:hypothetical protein [Cylindrospermum stagnale]AFZ26607.1 hypothetical protein Cylst_4529 [Cylindrospermum stagnale PCC 7417]
MNTKAIAFAFVLGISTFLSTWQQPAQGARGTEITSGDKNTAFINFQHLAQNDDGGDNGGD